MSVHQSLSGQSKKEIPSPSKAKLGKCYQKVAELESIIKFLKKKKGGKRKTRRKKHKGGAVSLDFPKPETSNVSSAGAIQGAMNKQKLGNAEVSRLNKEFSGGGKDDITVPQMGQAGESGNSTIMGGVKQTLQGSADSEFDNDVYNPVQPDGMPGGGRRRRKRKTKKRKSRRSKRRVKRRKKKTKRRRKQKGGTNPIEFTGKEELIERILEQIGPDNVGAIFETEEIINLAETNEPPVWGRDKKIYIKREDLENLGIEPANSNFQQLWNSTNIIPSYAIDDDDVVSVHRQNQMQALNAGPIVNRVVRIKKKDGEWFISQDINAGLNSGGYKKKSKKRRKKRKTRRKRKSRRKRR